ncbi:TetR-like C-terminal domain-containing protein [Lysinibacillus xylanilyticus]|uniref:TetR-like C-terminal domain-containing protein n=1 Tax=Lysinibacillus xylanilyticus TaxID=582475 RepID=UPI0038053E55
MIQILQVFYEEADFLKLILGPNGDPYFHEKMRRFFVRYFNAYLGNRTDKSKWRFPIELTIIQMQFWELLRTGYNTIRNNHQRKSPRC